MPSGTDTDVETDGRDGEAIDILAQLHGKNMPRDDAVVLKQKRAIDAALALENAEGP